jgi:hypothetical protein
VLRQGIRSHFDLPRNNLVVHPATRPNVSCRMETPRSTCDTPLVFRKQGQPKEDPVAFVAMRNQPTKGQQHRNVTYCRLRRSSTSPRSSFPARDSYGSRTPFPPAVRAYPTDKTRFRADGSQGNRFFVSERFLLSGRCVVLIEAAARDVFALQERDAM